MALITRRRCVRHLSLCAAAPIFSTAARAADSELPASQEQTISHLVQAFMAKHQIPSLSVAFASQGKLVYARAFGLADPTTGEKATTAHRYRIASVSKPITSVAIYLLIEQGKLKLSDPVCGNFLPVNARKIASPSVATITVHHLLTHTSGGWGNNMNDPMFQKPELNHADLIAWTLETQALDNEPGKSFAYSNFGYCVLGRVIENVSGKSYADFVQQQVLAPCGITDMQIAGNTRAEKGADEVVYVSAKAAQPYSMNVRRMDSHGGWLATPTDLVRFLTRVDGFDTTAELLRQDTLHELTKPTTANPSYASGFSVNTTPNWWHGGSLPGTATLAVRTASGMCWAGFANARSAGIGIALDRLMWQIAKSVPEWNA